MSEIKPKKERRFLKTLGRVGEILVEQVLLKLGSSIIKKIGGKKTLPSILFIFLSLSLFAQFPNTLNKQRLGFQTTGDGLTWRGSISDTASIQPTSNQNAWVILDTVNLKLYSFDFTSNVWNLVGGASGLTMPFDSITFNTAKDGTVGVGEVEYNDTQGSLIQGLKGGNVTNVIGQQLHQRVNNRTGATLTKGTAVYLSGSQGNRITVAKALGVTDAFSANTFGIVAENILNNQSGYVITEGLITNINTSSLVEDSAVYLSPTVAGGLTSTKPQAPQHTVYIGVCVKSNAGSGELFVKIRNGQELEELHDVRITSPVDRASLYYKSSEGLWRDTTATLLISDTASMLTNYLRTGTAASTYLPLTGGTVTGNTNFVPTTGRVIFGSSSQTWDEILGVNPRSTTSLGLGVYSNSSSYSGSLFRAQAENSIGSSYMLYEGRSTGGLPAFWVKGDGSSYFEKNITIGSEVNNDALDVHHDGDHGIRMSYLTAPSAYNFSIKPKVTASNVRYVFSQTNSNTFYDSILVFNQGNIGINKLNPSYKLDVNGTLGVTGATTLGLTLAVTGNITEGGNNVLTSGDTTSMLTPYWRSGRFSGVLPVANGGTNRTSMPAGYLLHGDGTSVDTSIGLFYNTSNKRLGVGTNNPQSPFQVDGTLTKSATNYWHYLMFDNTAPAVGVGAGFQFGGLKTSTAQEIFGAIDGYKETSSVTPGLNAAGAMRFHTQVADGTGLVEGMRLSSTQELGIGYGGTDNGAYKLQVNSQIFATNATIATSDIRFKENIQPLDKGLEIINKLKPVKFNFISTTENNFSEFDEIGFIAQDVEGALSTELFAKAVVKKLDEDKDDSPLGLMTEKLIPILTKAIQEQQALIKALEQRILILENK